MQFEELDPSAAPKAPAGKIINPAKPFEPIQYAGSSIVLPQGCYRVFRNPKDFVEVKAGSAYEAMQKSDIHAPHKIVRYTLTQMKVLSRQIMSQNEVAEETPEQATESAAPEAEAPQEEGRNIPNPTEEKAVSEGLEGDEVDVLLKDAKPPPPEDDMADAATEADTEADEAS